MKKTLPFCLALVATQSMAEETRQLDAHEHGVGVLNIAAEGSSVVVELFAPGADIVGFEYEATNAEDLKAIVEALTTLEDFEKLFALPVAAGCTVTEAHAELETEAEHDDHDDHEEEDEHDHDHEGEDHAEDDHDDHKDDDDHDHEDHADHDDHDHDEHAEEASHTEFHAHYDLECTTPSALTEITFAYFSEFPNALELEVQVVTSSGANAFEVERDEPTLDLGGLF